MSKRTSQWTILAAAIFILPSCVSFGGKAPANMLLLTAEQRVADGASVKGNAADALVVIEPAVPQKLNTNRVAVQVGASNVAYIKDAFWADKPARLMRSLLAETIAARSGKLVLSEGEVAARPNWMLSGTLVEFGMDAGSNEAIVVFDALLSRSGQPLEKRRFEARAVSADMKGGSAGVALNKAANQVVKDISDWLKASGH